MEDLPALSFLYPDRWQGDNKKRPDRPGLLRVAHQSSADAVRKRLKRTHDFQVGNRYLRPKVLSSRHFRSNQDLISLSTGIGSFKHCFLHEHSRG